LKLTLVDGGRSPRPWPVKATGGTIFSRSRNQKGLPMFDTCWGLVNRRHIHVRLQLTCHCGASR
jgi:hypothetical protein